MHHLIAVIVHETRRVHFDREIEFPPQILLLHFASTLIHVDLSFRSFIAIPPLPDYSYISSSSLIFLRVAHHHSFTHSLISYSYSYSHSCSYFTPIPATLHRVPSSSILLCFMFRTPGVDRPPPPAMLKHTPHTHTRMHTHTSLDS